MSYCQPLDLLIDAHNAYKLPHDASELSEAHLRFDGKVLEKVADDILRLNPRNMNLLSTYIGSYRVSLISSIVGHTFYGGFQKRMVRRFTEFKTMRLEPDLTVDDSCL